MNQATNQATNQETNQPITSWVNRSPGDLRVELAEVAATAVEPVVKRAVQAAPDWAKQPLADRVACLRKAQSALVNAQDSLAYGIALETGKPLREAKGEVGAVIAKIDLTIADAERYLPPRAVTDGPHPAQVRRRSKGPAAIVGPFNFPLHLPHGAAVAHLLAGNPVVFKPSPLAANVAAQYSQLIQASLPEGVFGLVQGGAPEGEALCLHPKIRAVSFTGSVPVGRSLAQALAADFSKDLALELGGKNALIVCADADLSAAAKAAAEGACLTAGQRCNATSRVLVQRQVAEPFLELFLAALAHYQPGDPLNIETTLGPLINQTAVERFQRLLAQTGGQWLLPGAVEPEVNGKPGYYVRPGVMLWQERAVGLASALHCQEAFAPLVEVFIVEDLEDALAVHNSTPFGLTTSIFTRSQAQFEALADCLQVGNVYANLATTFSPSTLPFGGLGESGNGKPGGREFIRFVTDEQAVQIAASSFSSP
ncbi:aldehyde dehydrogenase family protein [Leptolyngbya sp. FACHB-261]|nr:aldehyde dehydrogenase family protein [Leptolyngbya sp. FACHB-261]